MDSALDEYVIIEESKVIVNDKGEVTSHPLRMLYDYNETTKKNINLNEFVFAGDYLQESKILHDIRLFEVIFHGEPQEKRWREEWADPLRADILERLSGENRSWYLSYFNPDLDICLHRQSPCGISEALQYLPQKEAQKIALIDSRLPFGYGNEHETRAFFEVPNDTVNVITQKIWSETLQPYSIQGINMMSDQISLLREWNKQERTETLFREILDIAQIFFYSWPEEQRYFRFFTSKMKVDDFCSIIRIDELREKAKEILNIEKT